MSGQHHGKKKGSNKNAGHASHEETPLSKFPKAAQPPASSGAAATPRPDPSTILKPSQVSPTTTTPQRANGSSSSSSTPASSPSPNEKGITKPLTPRGSPSGSGAGAAPSSTARPRHASPMKPSPAKPSTTNTEKPAASKPTTTAHSLSPAAPLSTEAAVAPSVKKGKAPAKQASSAALAAAAAVAPAAPIFTTDTAVKPITVEASSPRRSSGDVCTPPDTGLASPPSRPEAVQDPPASSPPAAPAQAPSQPAVAEPVQAIITESAPAAPLDMKHSVPSVPATTQPLMAAAIPFPPASFLPVNDLQADMQASLADMQACPTSMLAPTPERKPQDQAWVNDYQNASFETFNISEAGIGGRSNSNAFDEADEIMASILSGDSVSPQLDLAGPSPAESEAADALLQALLDAPDFPSIAAAAIMPAAVVAAAAAVAVAEILTAEEEQPLLAPDLSDNALGDRAGSAGSENFPIPAFVIESGALPALLAAVSDATEAAAADASGGVVVPDLAAAEAAEAGVAGAVGYVEDGWLRSANGALAPRHVALFSVLRALVRARTMGQHKEALSHFSRTIMWDVPPILMRDREQMRVAVYLAKFAAHMDFKGVIVGVSTSPEGWEMVEALLSFQLCPVMPWWMMPVRLIMPKRIDIQSVIKIGTRPSISHSPDRVTWLWGRIHNFPVFPDLARVFSAFMMGRLALWTEPIWCRVLWMVGDSSYGNGKFGLTSAGKSQGHLPGNY